MDDFEKRVLSIRKTSLSENILINNNILDNFVQKGILKKEQSSEILSEKTKYSKWHKFLEFLYDTPSETSSFDYLCSSLIENDQSKVAKELQADLKQMRGDIEVSDKIKKEASLLVHRKFGSSKRVCEYDKRNMAELLALKMQIMTDEFYSHTSLADEKVKSEKAYIKKLHELIESRTKALRKFMKDNEEQLTSRAHDMYTTSDLFKRMSSTNGKDLLDELKELEETLMQQTRRLITHRETLIEERKRCLRILGAGDDQSLDGALSQGLAGADWFIPTKRSPASRRAKSSLTVPKNSEVVRNEEEAERMIRKLHKRRAELLNQLAKKDLKISGMEEKIEELENELEAMKTK